MIHFRVRWEKQGAHIHVRLFAATRENTTHSHCGKLIFAEAEWEAFLRCFNDHGEDRVVVIPEDGEP
jgi:hypothetical protein